MSKLRYPVFHNFNDNTSPPNKKYAADEDGDTVGGGGKRPSPLEIPMFP